MPRNEFGFEKPETFQEATNEGGEIQSMDIEFTDAKLNIDKNEDSNIIDLNDNSLTKALNQHSDRDLKKNKLNNLCDTPVSFSKLYNLVAPMPLFIV